MANKITKNVSTFDANMGSNKLSKKKTVEMVNNVQKGSVGGSWANDGYGTQHDPEREAKQKNYAKADYLEPPEHTLDDVMAGKPLPDPVKKPTARNIADKEYLKHFASDKVLADGHSSIEDSQLSKLSAGQRSYRGDGRGNS